MFLLLRLLLILFIAGILWRFLWGNEKSKAPRRPAAKPASLEEMKQDPVCGTWLPESQALKETVGEETRYFCSPECRNKFLSAKKS
jgi:uncharacterized protein